MIFGIFPVDLVGLEMARSNFSQDVSWLAICGLPGDTFIHLEQADEAVEPMGRLFRSDNDSNKYFFFL